MRKTKLTLEVHHIPETVTEGELPPLPLGQDGRLAATVLVHIYEADDPEAFEVWHCTEVPPLWSRSIRRWCIPGEPWRERQRVVTRAWTQETIPAMGQRVLLWFEDQPPVHTRRFSHDSCESWNRHRVIAWAHLPTLDDTEVRDGE